jgi:hypothetical protein
MEYTDEEIKRRMTDLEIRNRRIVAEIAKLEEEEHTNGIELDDLELVLKMRLGKSIEHQPGINPSCRACAD